LSLWKKSYGKECISCGQKGHTYLQCNKKPFFGMLAGAFGLNTEPFCGLTNKELE
jgi:hypothetical protein